MSSAEGVDDVPPETKPAEEKPVKEKKPRAPKAPKEKKPKAPKSSSPSHPPYFSMIKEAIIALNEKTGSSHYAIAKYMEEKHKGVLPANFRKMLAVQLKNFAAKGKLVKVKASFKLSDSGKNEDKKAMKPNKGSSKRKVSAAAAAVVVPKKKPAVSSKSPKVSKAKKPVVRKTKRAAPKSIKSPVGKKAKKA